MGILQQARMLVAIHHYHHQRNFRRTGLELLRDCRDRARAMGAIGGREHHRRRARQFLLQALPAVRIERFDCVRRSLRYYGA